MTEKTIPFCYKNINKIINDEEWLTVRYNFNKNIKEEDEVELVHNSPRVQSQIPCAQAKIDTITEMTIQEFVDRQWEGHKNYENARSMTYGLSHFYNTEDMTGDTTITVIEFDVTNKYV